MPRSPRRRQVASETAAPLNVDAAAAEPDGEAAAFLPPTMIAERPLKQLLNADDGYKQQIDSLTGELREEIKNAVERKHLDKDAYALLKKLRRQKTPEKKALLFHTFLAYVRLSGELRIIESVPSLFEDAAPAPTQGSAEVVPIRQAAE